MTNELKVLLISGLPLEKKTSFSCQFNFLSLFLKKKGIESVIAGPSTNGKSLNLKYINDLIKKLNAKASILLGYPDQFPFLTDKEKSGIPVLLWAQFSKPPEAEALGNAIPVPLTEKTKTFLMKSGVSNIGPVIPHGVDTEVFHQRSDREREQIRKEYGLQDRFVVGTVAANTRRKGFDRIIESFSIFAKKREEALLLIKTDRVLSMDGADLKSLSERSGVYKRTKILDGDFDERKLSQIYAIMDVYLNLSEWEGFCIPVIEAMACGIPIITHPVQGPVEIVPYQDLLISKGTTVQEGETILLLADPDKTASILLKASNNHSLLRKLGKLGIKEVEKRYDIRIVADQWERLIRSIVKVFP